MNIFEQPTRANASGFRRNPARPPRVREASIADYQQIAAVLLRNALTPRAYPNWVRLWTGNPAYEASGTKWPLGWVLETEGGEIVGTLSNVPAFYRLNGRVLTAAAACDWAVDEQYRAYSLILLDRLSRQGNVDLLLCTTVSVNSEPAYSVFGWSKVPAGSWDRSLFWITSYHRFAQSALSLKGVPCGALLAFPAAAALFLRDAFLQSPMRSAKQVDVEMCHDFDARFDAFWEELDRQSHDVLLGVRTREVLQWHFRDALHRGDAWILAASASSRLIAYAVFDRLDNPGLKLRRVRLADFQALCNSEEVLLSFLSVMRSKCCAEGVHMVENVGCWLDRPGFRRVPATYQRSFPAWTFYYKAVGTALSETLKDPAVWNPSCFDGDMSL